MENKSPEEITGFVASSSRPMDDIIKDLDEEQQNDLLKAAQKHNIDADDPLWHLVGAYISGSEFNKETIKVVEAAREAAIAATQEKVDAMALKAGEAVIGQIKDVFANEIETSITKTANMATQNISQSINAFETHVEKVKKEIAKSRKTESKKNIMKFMLLPVLVSIIAIAATLFFVPSNKIINVGNKVYLALPSDGVFEDGSETYIKVKKLPFEKK